MKTQVGVVIFHRRGDEILLAMKKRGFGEGRWNGTGGKPEAGESLREAVIRETREEIGITPTKFELAAHILFRYPEGEIKLWDGYAFICTEWEGEPYETEEMAPRWFNLDDIPYEQMWDDDTYWLPLVLAGKKVEAEFVFDADDKVTEHHIRVVE